MTADPPSAVTPEQKLPSVSESAPGRRPDKLSSPAARRRCSPACRDALGGSRSSCCCSGRLGLRGPACAPRDPPRPDDPATRTSGCDMCDARPSPLGPDRTPPRTPLCVPRPSGPLPPAWRTDPPSREGSPNIRRAILPTTECAPGSPATEPSSDGTASVDGSGKGWRLREAPM